MVDPVVSVVITTYNHEKFIAKCLEGVLAQKVDFPVEIIIGDDCSIDQNQKIIREYIEQNQDTNKIFRLLFHQENLIEPGLLPGKLNFMHCITASKGRYCALCEGDDYWIDSHKLQKQFDLLESDSTIALAYHPVHLVDEHNEIFLEREEITPFKQNQFEVLDYPINTCSVMFRVPVDFPKEFKLAPNGDKFLFSLVARKGNIFNLGFVGASYRKSSAGSFSSLEKYQRESRNIRTRRLMIKSGQFEPGLNNRIRKLIIKRKFRAMKELIKTGNITGALKIPFL